MEKLISIVGLTATGKTDLAFKITEFLAKSDGAELTGFDIISADSRQVFSDIPILSGADVPASFKLKTEKAIPYPFFQRGSVNLHGVGFLGKNEDWSVAHFIALARRVVNWSWSQNRLPLVVGGTGLYHQQLLDPAVTVNLKPDLELRRRLEELSTEDLQQRLKEIAPVKWQQLNNSDRANPRRLVRAIEVATLAQSQSKNIDQDSQHKFEELAPHQVLKLGIKETDQLAFKIRERVEDRFSQGAVAEVRKIIASEKFDSAHSQISSATGFSEIQKFIEGELSQTECLAAWTQREIKYAKRQLTWFKKRSDINWISADQDQIWQKLLGSVIFK